MSEEPTLLEQINARNEEDERRAREEAEQTAGQTADQNTGNHTFQGAGGPGESSRVRTNPVMDARLNQYIEKNKQLYEDYQAHPKEDLIRKLMMKKMKREEYRERNDQIIDWLDRNPQIRQEIEEQTRHLPLHRQYDATIREAKERAASQTFNADSDPNVNESPNDVSNTNRYRERRGARV